jgi:hypothetical protein
MAAYLYEGLCFDQIMTSVELKNGMTASVEPSAMPGNATFVAGFTQCKSNFSEYSSMILGSADTFC